MAGADDPAATVVFEVRGNLAERLDVHAQPALMKAIAETSGGLVFEDTDPRMLAEHFDRHLARTRPERIVRAKANEKLPAPGTPGHGPAADDEEDQPNLSRLVYRAIAALKDSSQLPVL